MHHQGLSSETPRATHTPNILAAAAADITKSQLQPHSAFSACFETPHAGHKPCLCGREMVHRPVRPQAALQVAHPPMPS